MTTWFDDPHRPTRDVDFLGYGDPTPESMLSVFREICAVEENDGIIFDADALQVELIREELEYGGVRLRTTAQLAGARITIVIDIGFGDAIEPGIEEISLPVSLDVPTPRLRTYARKTVVAEKFHAMVMLGLANTRMKDFYDIWILSRNYAFDGERLSRAITATFQRRISAIPEDALDALTPAFARCATKQRQWEAFVRDLAVDVPSIKAIVKDLAAFLMPHAQQARRRGERQSVERPDLNICLQPTRMIAEHALTIWVRQAKSGILKPGLTDKDNEFTLRRGFASRLVHSWRPPASVGRSVGLAFSVTFS